MKTKNQGFALLIAVIFMSVMLSFGLMLGSLAYKQTLLASSALQSQYAFYAADAALECVLYADQQEPSKPFVNGGSFKCDGNTYTISPPSSKMEVKKITLDNDSRCADVTVYKYASPITQTDGQKVSTYLFSQGYSVSCDDLDTARFAARGLQAHY